MLWDSVHRTTNRASARACVDVWHMTVTRVKAVERQKVDYLPSWPYHIYKMALSQISSTCKKPRHTKRSDTKPRSANQSSGYDTDGNPIGSPDSLASSSIEQTATEDEDDQVRPAGCEDGLCDDASLHARGDFVKMKMFLVTFAQTMTTFYYNAKPLEQILEVVKTKYAELSLTAAKQYFIQTLDEESFQRLEFKRSEIKTERYQFLISSNSLHSSLFCLKFGESELASRRKKSTKKASKSKSKQTDNKTFALIRWVPLCYHSIKYYLEDLMQFAQDIPTNPDFFLKWTWSLVGTINDCLMSELAHSSGISESMGRIVLLLMSSLAFESDGCAHFSALMNQHFGFASKDKIDELAGKAKADFQATTLQYVKKAKALILKKVEEIMTMSENIDWAPDVSTFRARPYIDDMAMFARSTVQTFHSEGLDQVSREILDELTSYLYDSLSFAIMNILAGQEVSIFNENGVKSLEVDFNELIASLGDEVNPATFLRTKQFLNLLKSNSPGEYLDGALLHHKYNLITNIPHLLKILAKYRIGEEQGLLMSMFSSGSPKKQSLDLLIKKLNEEIRKSAPK
eukprot:TRINITY_DN8284_c0_g1_i1.p1 TRINITY_DN8284_c0_g1~~TRINITY_DN8284_c0_g1_i1.p1  ORF type:complete len:572 (-),score=185.72 TRINITY_DN8284_c0_g1_i1:24-1739(-)